MAAPYMFISEATPIKPLLMNGAVVQTGFSHQLGRVLWLPMAEAQAGILDLVNNQQPGNSASDASISEPWRFNRAPKPPHPGFMRLKITETPHQGNTQLLNFGFKEQESWDQISRNLSEPYNFQKVIYERSAKTSRVLEKLVGTSGSEMPGKNCKNHYYQAIAGDDQSEAKLQERTEQLMGKRNNTLDKQFRYGLCGISELARQVASVIGSPCFDGRPPTDYQSNLKTAVGHGLHLFRQQVARYGANNVFLVWIPERNEAATGRVSRLASNYSKLLITICPKGM